jgi:hypothetical protein
MRYHCVPICKYSVEAISAFNTISARGPFASTHLKHTAAATSQQSLTNALLTQTPERSQAVKPLISL